MYLVDTDVISNARKRTRANLGVRRFFGDAATQGIPLFLSAVTIDELRQGVEACAIVATSRRRLGSLVGSARSRVTTLTRSSHSMRRSRSMGRLRVPHAENPLDKQIAATALMYGLPWSPVTCPTTSLPA